MEYAADEFRCRKCHRLLFKGVLVEGEIDIKCKACKTVTSVKKTQFNQLLCMIAHCPNRIHCPSAQQER